MRERSPVYVPRNTRGGLGWSVRFALLVDVAFTVVLTAVWTQRLDGFASSPLPTEPTVRFDTHLPDVPSEPALPLDRLSVPVEHRLRPGETLAGVFRDLGLDPAEASTAVSAAARHLDPRKVRAGNAYLAYLGPESRLERVVFPYQDRGEVMVERADGGWESRFEPYRLATRELLVTGELDGPLESSIEAAGGPAALAYELADVFQWDLDFNRDLRLGDRFSVLCESEWRDGRLHRVGAVLAAVYENRGERHEAYRYGDDGYYDDAGRPLRKQFLRSPLPFSRITSRFTNRRFHPVLKVYRPHYGVDYGAPAGTPVRVTASGSVVLAGWTKGGGNTVRVRHPNGVETSYLHMSRFAAGLRAGRRVHQGEVIGFVGATGLATAPHLDYRVQINGRYLDPLSLDNRPSPPLSNEMMPAFLTARDRYRWRLAGESLPAPDGGAPTLAGP